MDREMSPGLSIALVVIGIAVVCLMVFSSQKTTYFGYTNSNTSAEEVVSEKDGLAKHNTRVEPSSDFEPKKGDLVKLVSKDDGKTFYK